MADDSRTSMVRSAASLIGSRGMTATSFSEVLADSGSPRGSIYHHFPFGKKQLVEDAIRWTSDRVLAHQAACGSTTPEGVLFHFVSMWREIVLSSAGTQGCMVAGVALDAEPDLEGLMDVVRTTFRAWVALLSEQFEKAGVPSYRAWPAAVAVLAAVEGALVLCRAEGGVGPLDTVAGQLRRLL
jgi:TetR/AcrR family transcriptional repressor of lmrAB and yxaGH operons